MIGDQMDMVRRLKSVLPNRWFADDTPTLDLILNSTASVLSFIHNQILRIGRQSRLATADNIYLDVLARDYLGARYCRRFLEGDVSFRSRVRSDLLRERCTRKAVLTAIHDLTGRDAQIFEPRFPADTGAYGSLKASPASALAYGMAGGWGNLNHPCQLFITAYRPVEPAPTAGIGWGRGGYNLSKMAYADFDILRGRVSDTEISSAIMEVVPISTSVWLRIYN